MASPQRILVGSLVLVTFLVASCGRTDALLERDLDRARRLVFIQGFGPGGKSFFIQPFEVTKGEFLEFVRATSHRSEHSDFLRDMRLRDGSLDAGTVEDHPVVFVTSADAQAYLGWIGMELPTLRQWRSALRNHPLAKGARILDPAFLANGYQSGIGKTSPVGFFYYDRTPEGCFDLIGNVAEWTRTRAYYPVDPDGEVPTILSLDLDTVSDQLQIAAGLSGSPIASRLAAEPSELAEALTATVVEGHSFQDSWVDSDFTTDTMVTLASGWRPLSPDQCLDVIGFRGVVDAATLVRRLANRAVDVPSAGRAVIDWIARQPDEIEPLLVRLAEENEPGAPLVKACLDERRSR
ncbi:MAG: SUMF1/EgtB/PvdO family nonheme iron enzyme [Planctomycetes bacterium]|nr:SUMF1/EgtB/PvdO family nonheme iron enzyme [Planctomycetota bacterium]